MSFDESQVTAWLEVWRQSNASPLAQRGMRPLPPDVALGYPELAEQPLLLLMLALYDADANALQRRSADLGQTELYGRLLIEFARREIRKHSGNLPEAELERAVEAELLRLSVVAFAMFNRRSQWISDTELDTDLSVLPGGNQDTHRPGGLRAPLTAAQLAVGRFFFVHESQATRDDTRLQTYEFLHATFGEFLVARLVTQVLTGMAAREQAAAGSPLGAADDGLLHALLSFAALTARAPIVAFLDDLLDRLDPQQRAALAGMLLQLHARALYPRTETAYGRYEPLPLTTTARNAAWSTNLAVLAVLTAGEITGTQLFPGDPDPAVPWRNQAMMWRSQLTSEEWFGLHDAIALERTWDGQRRGLRLWRHDGTFTAPATDMYWTYNIPPGHPNRRGIFAWGGHSPPSLQRKTNFTCGKSDDFMNHGLQPLASAFPTVANVVVTLGTDRPVSATHVLLAALVAPYQDGEPSDTAYLDLAHVTREIAQASNVEHDYGTYLKTALGILITAVEQGNTSPASLAPLIGSARASNPEDTQLTELLDRLGTLQADQRTGPPN
jgi:hypothetical protein